MTIQGDEESGTREEAPLTPAPRQKVSEILGNNLDVFRVCFFLRHGQIWIFGGWSYKYHICIFFLVGKWQPYRTTKWAQKRSSSGWSGQGDFQKKAPNLGFITQLQHHPGFTLSHVVRIPKDTPISSLEMAFGFVEGSGTWHVEMVGFEMVKHHFGNTMLYTFACYKHLEPTVSGSPFNFFILHILLSSGCGSILMFFDLDQGNISPMFGSTSWIFFHRFVIRLVWCRNTESRNVWNSSTPTIILSSARGMLAFST